MAETGQYERARRIVKSRFDFYQHLGVFVVLISFLAVLNHILSPGRYWVIWPLIFWGVAVALHGVSALLTARREDLMDRLTQEEMAKADTEK